MARKQLIKTSEARILVFLESVTNGNRFVGHIASKLGIDYGYTIRILDQMKTKQWVKKTKYVTKSYYFLTKKAPLEKAKEVIANG